MKSKFTSALIAAGLIIAGVAGGYWFAVHRMAGSASMADATAATPSADKKPLYY